MFIDSVIDKRTSCATAKEADCVHNGQLWEIDRAFDLLERVI